ncbi:phosphoribosylformylglycinamidine synthase subunit PurL [Carboxylicivirga sp. N1Y90]|uniref:phosphoribosylformylglycinamidine synthase subunit PurL n=1 Tax=Carboxylicivirga fragile TaxID=3417571 RepID=UPI003D356971|nr:phosphoribosylformylglycinamidine synthase subunit PurL [Marinilabiliaceae bacterium N1Y90]
METSLPIKEEAERLNICSEEFDKIKEILNREPNGLELEVFSLLWSEHASYKSSLKWLKTLPVDGDKVLVKAGDDSAGAVDLGNGLACVMKVESHNHPCSIQPRLGSITGLRTVTRDITAMGARPLSVLSSMRFGEGKRDTARWLFAEVSDGLSEFEKGFNVPIVGGETYFSEGYNSSPVVNNLSIGVVEKSKIVEGKASGVGNLILVVGALTGKDGIDSDVFASDLLAEVSTKAVAMEQLMDVSSERNLVDLVQELTSGISLKGLNTIGTHGIIGAACEMSTKGKVGINLELENVKHRDEVLNAREVLLSQTWARIMVCIEPKDLKELSTLVEKYNLSVSTLGQVVEGDLVSCNYKGECIGEFPSQYMGLGELAPHINLPGKSIKQEALDIKLDLYNEPDHYPDVIKQMLVNLNVTSKRWLTDKFERSLNKEGLSHQYPSDAAFIDLEGTNQALAATMDCNSAYMQTDANIGAQIAVAEAARNIVCGGGVPLAISDCLNFGNPKDEEIYGTFIDSIKGITKACQDFKIPVISGNVSFYNQRSEEGQLKAITPTPVIGMVGLVEDKRHHSTLSFRHKGDMIFIIGKSRNDVNSSEYAHSVLNVKKSIPPYYNVEEELELQATISEMIRVGLVRSVHDVSNGGLFFSLLESGIPLEFGFDITSDAEVRKDAFLFGESQSRVIVSVSPAKQDDFVDFMIDKGVAFSILGHVTKGELRIDDESYGYIKDLKKLFEARLGQWVDDE